MIYRNRDTKVTARHPFPVIMRSFPPLSLRGAPIHRGDEAISGELYEIMQKTLAPEFKISGIYGMELDPQLPPYL